MSGTEFALWLKENIVKKLTQLNICIDDELPDYIMIMVANNKEADCMKEDLDIFLSNKTNEFVDWLQRVIKPGSAEGCGADVDGDYEMLLRPNDDEQMEEVFLVNPVEADFDEEEEIQMPNAYSKSKDFQTNETQREELMDFEDPIIEIPPKSVSVLAVKSSSSPTRRELPLIIPTDVQQKVVRLVNDQERAIRNSFSEELQRPLTVRNDNLDQCTRQIVSRSLEPISVREVKSAGKGKHSYQERKRELGLKPQAIGCILFQAMAEANGSVEGKAAARASLKRLHSSTDRKIPRSKLKKTNEHKKEVLFTDLRLILIRKQMLRNEQIPNKSQTVRSKIVLPINQNGETPIMRKNSAVHKLRLEIAKERLEERQQQMSKENGEPLKKESSKEKANIQNKPSKPLARNDGSPKEKSPPRNQSKIEKCRYWPYCANQKCAFHHPICACKYFPYCKLGDKCLFGHPLCRYDALCIKADCPFSHFSRNANKVSSTQNGEASSSSLAKPGSTATANNTNDANSDQRSSKAFKSRYVAPNLVKSKIYRA